MPSHPILFQLPAVSYVWPPLPRANLVVLVVSVVSNAKLFEHVGIQLESWNRVTHIGIQRETSNAATDTGD